VPKNEESTCRTQILIFLHSGRRPRYISPLVVFVRDLGSSGGSGSLAGDAEIFLLVCGRGSEWIEGEYLIADWPAVIF